MSTEPKCCKRLTAGLSPLDATYKKLTKNRGVHPSSQKFSPCEGLLVSFRPSSPQLSRLASLFPIFRTLFQLPYPASLICRSYENCQVSANNSHFGTHLPVEHSSPRYFFASLLPAFPLLLTREPKQHTFRHRWNPSPSADEKQIPGSGHPDRHPCYCRIAPRRRSDGAAARARSNALAMAGDHSLRRLCHLPPLADRLDLRRPPRRRGVWPRLALHRSKPATPRHHLSAPHQGHHRAVALRRSRRGHCRPLRPQESRPPRHQIPHLLRSRLHARDAHRLCGHPHQPRRRRRPSPSVLRGASPQCFSPHRRATHHRHF